MQAELGSIAIFILSTYTDGTAPKGAEWFCTWLGDTVDDFRVSKTLLSGLRFAVFGLGNSLYANNFNAVSSALRHQSVVTSLTVCEVECHDFYCGASQCQKPLEE